MPAGFPNFRHDPTTAPHYIQRSSPSSASSTSQTTSQSQQRYRDSASQPAEGVKLSKYQYPTEREPKPKKQSNPKVRGEFEKL